MSPTPPPPPPPPIQLFGALPALPSTSRRVLHKVLTPTALWWLLTGSSQRQIPKHPVHERGIFHVGVYVYVYVCVCVCVCVYACACVGMHAGGRACVGACVCVWWACHLFCIAISHPGLSPPPITSSQQASTQRKDNNTTTTQQQRKQRLTLRPGFLRTRQRKTKLPNSGLERWVGGEMSKKTKKNRMVRYCNTV